MKDTKTSGAAEKTPAETGAGTAAPQTPAKPAAKTADKAAAPKATVPELKKGDYFKFGSYYQENSSKKTPIEWLVLKSPAPRRFSFPGTLLIASSTTMNWRT